MTVAGGGVVERGVVGCAQYRVVVCGGAHGGVCLCGGGGDGGGGVVLLACGVWRVEHSLLNWRSRVHAVVCATDD